ncbi:hypothetical protein RND71_000418 [Anisodus tanguticus]|uniref:C2H2-type domain-containing protein n=1 Tax=Anisodus tanguticus TaxID=243964 RepID=A0AAE1SZD6_9SOLA|nr:hypothetical protein RND71_000418 [Anisodus tanguticus]
MMTRQNVPAGVGISGDLRRRRREAELGPILSLGYPLYISIQAIETGSMVLVWSYLRLIFICWLVIPQLNGEFYLYQNLVHPYLQFKLPDAVTQFYASCSKLFEKLKDSSIDKETFLAVAKLTGSKVGNIDEDAFQIENKTSSAIQVECDICEVTVFSEMTLQSHLRGKRHRAEANLWCTLCNLRCSGEIDMIAHLKGKRHLAKLQESFANAGAS